MAAPRGRAATALRAAMPNQCPSIPAMIPTISAAPSIAGVSLSSTVLKIGWGSINMLVTATAMAEVSMVVTTARVVISTRSSSRAKSAPASGRWKDAASPAPAAEAMRMRRAWGSSLNVVAIQDAESPPATRGAFSRPTGAPAATEMTWRNTLQRVSHRGMGVPFMVPGTETAGRPNRLSRYHDHEVIIPTTTSVIANRRGVTCEPGSSALRWSTP